MKTIIIWIVLLHGLGQYTGLDAKLVKYDMAENCERTVSMSVDDIYGIDVVMNMTSRMGTLGRCRLTLKRRSALNKLHFYITDSILSDCGTMSLYIKEGDSLTKTVPLSAVPRVCGLKKIPVTDKDLRTSKRYLVLEFSWKLTTMFTGIAFRLIANTYTCSVACASGLHRCYQGHCIKSNLYNQPGYDFCGSAAICPVEESRGGHDNEKTRDSELPSGVFNAFAILLGLAAVILLFIIWRCSKRSIYDSNDDNCVACLKSCFSHCFYLCCSCWCRCCEGCCDGPAQYMSNTRQRLDRWCCVGPRDSLIEVPCCLACTETDTVITHSPTQPGLTGEQYPDEQGYSERHAMMTDNRVVTDPTSPPPSYTVIMETPDGHSVPITDAGTGSPTAQPRYSIETEYSPNTPIDPHTEPPSYDIAREYPPTSVSAERHTDPPSYDVSTANLSPTDQFADPPSYDAVMVNLSTNSPNDPLIYSPDYGALTVNLPTVTPNEPHVDPPSYTVATRGTVHSPSDTPIVSTTDSPSPSINPPSYDQGARDQQPTDELPDYNEVMANRTLYDT